MTTPTPRQAEGFDIKRRHSLTPSKSSRQYLPSSLTYLAILRKRAQQYPALNDPLSFQNFTLIPLPTIKATLSLRKSHTFMIDVIIEPKGCLSWKNYWRVSFAKKFLSQKEIQRRMRYPPRENLIQRKKKNIETMTIIRQKQLKKPKPKLYYQRGKNLPMLTSQRS